MDREAVRRDIEALAAMVRDSAGALPALSLVSIRDGGFTNYHLPTDVPEHVDWDSVEVCARLAEGIARVWNDSDPT